MSDLISRQAAIEAVGDVHPLDYNGQAILTRLKELPTIESKRGKWIDGKYMGFDGCFVWHRECSECGYERDDDNPDKDTNYCPNCGAKMDESEECEDENWYTELDDPKFAERSEDG